MADGPMHSKKLWKKKNGSVIFRLGLIFFCLPDQTDCRKTPCEKSAVRGIKRRWPNMVKIMYIFDPNNFVMGQLHHSHPVPPNLVICMLAVIMETPERWRALPRRALFVSILAQKSSKDVKMSCRDAVPRRDPVPWRHVMSWRRTVTSRDVMSWCHMTSGVMTNWLCVIQPSETLEITFFNLATLTFDLWPWPSNSFEILSRSMPPPNFGSVCQTVQPWERWLTDRQTDTHTGPILYPWSLTREGKRLWRWPLRVFACMKS